MKSEHVCYLLVALLISGVFGPAGPAWGSAAPGHPVLVTASLKTAHDDRPEPDGGTRRIGPVDIRPEVLTSLVPGQSISLTICPFADTCFEVLIDNGGTLAYGSRSWTGRVVDADGSRVRFMHCDDVLVGAVAVPGRGMFVIRPAPDGSYQARELDEGVVASCGYDHHPHLFDPAKNPIASFEKSSLTIAVESSSIAAGCDDGTVIDVLIVYTEAARIAAGGVSAMNALIDGAVADANDAFMNSLIDTSLRVVGREEVVYAETGIWQTDGPRLVDPNDGYLDDVHPLRDQLGADCVSLWVEGLNTGGIGYYPDPSLTGVNASGFSLLRIDNAPFLTFAHEIGHNLFCAHDRPNANSGDPFADYSYGYVEPGQAWQTIMAVTVAPTIPHFANPNVIWPGPVPPNPGPTGVPDGQPEPSDVALTINQTRHFVANFRPTAVPGLPSVIHVRSDAPAGGDGLTWATALNDLNHALCLAAGSQGAVEEIWVKSGTYFPDQGSGDRTATFRLRDHLAIYGGFAGTETQRGQRDPMANLTILSGDIGLPSVDTDNSYHVLTGSGCNTTAILDGFAVTSGRADGGIDVDDGGAALLVSDGGSPTIMNCTFSLNTAARFGGAVYCSNGSSPAFDGCLFLGNTALGTTWPEGGGAVYSYSGSHPKFTDCVFDTNTGNLGGAVANLFDCHPTFTACIFTRNVAVGAGADGGAIYNYSNCSPEIDQCVIEDNEAAAGGGISNWFGSAPGVTGTILRGNTVTGDGGAVFNYDNCPVQMVNSLMIGNSAGYGAAMMNLFSSDSALINCSVVGNTATGYQGGIYSYDSSPTIDNTILWSNVDLDGSIQSSQLIAWNGSFTINYSTVQGGVAGLGGVDNSASDPLFVDADGADDVLGTPDDDVHLQAGSPSIDTGNTSALPAGTFADLDGGPRLWGIAVDRGAYEYVEPVPADADGDGDVDANDLAAFENCATGPAIGPPAPGCEPFDFDTDGDIDNADHGVFQRCFSGSNQPAEPACDDG